MALSDLIKQRDVAAQLDRVIPSYTRPLAVPVRVPARSQKPGLIGTAFDYAFRFELQRIAPTAVENGWVAEQAVEQLRDTAEHSCGPDKTGGRARRSLQRAKRVVRGARRYVAQYQARQTVQRSSRGALARHALRLAKLDTFYRSGRLNDSFSRVAIRDAEEVLRLLDLVPFERFMASSAILLNPTFGTASALVGGADADLIVGDRLVDLKTTKRLFVERPMVRQLVGYMILAHRARRTPKTIPHLRALELYFARAGYLWSLPTAPILGHPAFRKVENWFVARAREETGLPVVENDQPAEVDFQSASLSFLLNEIAWSVEISGGVASVVGDSSRAAESPWASGGFVDRAAAARAISTASRIATEDALDVVDEIEAIVGGFVRRTKLLRGARKRMTA